jgi:hypothetical protein
MRLEPRAWKAYLSWLLCFTGTTTLQRARWLAERLRLRALLKR